MVAVRSAVLGLILALLGAGAWAQSWPERTLGDVDAARELILQNHPGATPDMADAMFQKRLADGYAQARSDAAKVADFPGYVAVMRAFALSFQDPHISWRPSEAMTDQTPPAPGLKVGKAGFGVRPYAGGMWIALERLDDSVPPVIAEAQAHIEEIKAAKRIVIDVRGNGGGNSELGDQLAAVLVGTSSMRASDRRPVGGCGVAWRASPGNQATLESYQVRFAQSSPELAKEVGEAAAEMEAALAQGRRFTAPIPPACLAERADTAPPPVVAPGRLIVLTDEACFSSCLIFVDRLLRLGAVQAGQPTREGNWYMEVRAAPLPSGLGQFRTMQKVAMEFPRKMGPYMPTKPYAGDIADTAALELWLAR